MTWKQAITARHEADAVCLLQNELQKRLCDALHDGFLNRHVAACALRDYRWELRRRELTHSVAAKQARRTINRLFDQLPRRTREER